MRWRSAAALAVGLAAVLPAAPSSAAEPDRPEIVSVSIPGRVTAGHPAAARLVFRAPKANVVAVILALEDLDGPLRVTSQREISVVAAAFGREEGELVVPLVFATPGRKRAVFTLRTDEREDSDRERVELDVAP
jgi:hypothetical protein